MFNKQVLTNASREAARAGIVGSGPDDAAIEGIALSYCQDYLVTFDPDSSGATVTISHPSGQDHPNPLTVTVSYSYRFLLLPDLQKMFGGEPSSGVTIVGKINMRLE